MCTDDGAGGDDILYDDEEETVSPAPVNIAENSVNQKDPYFSIVEVLEKAKVSDTVQLKCEVKDADCKLIKLKEINYLHT